MSLFRIYDLSKKQSFITFLSQDKSGKKLELATVIAPYDATSKEQLTLAKGQMIIIKKKSDTGWWQGELQSGVSFSKRELSLDKKTFNLREI